MTAKAQQHAFNHLRDEARAAHLAGDGLRVNHLCSIALTRFTKLTGAQQLLIDLTEIKWACIFPLHWLLDDYMTRTVKEAIEEAQKSKLATSQLSQVLHAAH